MKFCFNCGIPIKSLSKGQRTKDHIPPQSFYLGFPEHYKSNRKTVDCCFKCNNDFSRIDELFRNILGFTNDIEGNKEVTTVAVKSLFEKGQVVRGKDKIPAISVSQTDIYNFHKRCFKALHSKTYREYLDENNFQITLIHEHDYEIISYGMILQQFVTKDNSWQISGHSDVFKYCIKQIAFDENKEMITASNMNSAVFIGIVMVYLESYAVVVLAQKK